MPFTAQLRGHSRHDELVRTVYGVALMLTVPTLVLLASLLGW